MLGKTAVGESFCYSLEFRGTDLGSRTRHRFLKFFHCSLHSLPKTSEVVEWKRNLVAHGDAREDKWRGKRRMEWVASSLQFDSEQSIQCYYNRSPPTRTPRRPVLDWTDTPADINGLVLFAGRPNLVSARVPSRSDFTQFAPHCSYSSHRHCSLPSFSIDACICYALLLALCSSSLFLRPFQRWWKNIALLSNHYQVGYHVAICSARIIVVLEQKLHVKDNTGYSCGQLVSRDDKRCNKRIPLKSF